ncbi:MAG: alpha/beta fold hydrolase [Nitriliruptorales bacterium]|nr:alpha/beta fold hydrolase [Nitriliruptorales bacterium]
MTTLTETFIAVGGHPVRCLEGGLGPTLLFLHGMGGLRPGAPFLELLADRYRVVAPEHPGFGETEPLAWIDTMVDLATHYRRMLRETLSEEAVFVVGHSLGGWLAAEVAFQNPDLVRRQVLVAPAGLRGAGEGIDPFGLNEEQMLVTAVADPATAPPSPKPSDAHVIRNRQMAARLAWSPRLADPKLPTRLSLVRTPTLLIWGAQDRIIPADRAAAFQEHLPDVRLVTVEGAGHLPMLEAPERFVSAVNEFFDG